MSSKTKNIIRSKRFIWLLEAAIIIALSFIAYGNAIDNGYNIDDAYIVPLDSQNDIIKEDVKAIPELLKSRYNVGEGVTYGYRPMGKITMVYEYIFWGNNPRNSHIVNICFFALNTILLLCFIRMLWLIGIKIPKPVAYISVLLFLFHPIHTEVVCSIKNREELLCFIFMIGALMCYIKFLSKSKYLYLIPFALFAVISMLSKQTAFNIFGWLILITIVGARFGEVKLNKLFTILKVGAALFATFLLYSIVFIYVPSTLEASDIAYSFEQNPYKLYPGNISIPNGIQTLFFYIKKLLIPFPLLYYYGYDMLPVQNWNMVLPYIGIAIIIGLGLYVLRSFYKKSAFEIPFWIAAFSISIFPFSNLFKPIYITGVVGERLIYQASFAFCILLAFGVYYSITWLSKKQKLKKSHWLYISALLPIIITYYVITSQRSLQWEDKITLYEHDIKYLSRSARANSMIAAMYMKSLSGKSQSEQEKIVLKAKHYYNQSVEVYPNYNDSWLRLGIIQSQYLNNIDSAIVYLSNISKDSSITHLSSLELMGDIYGRGNQNDSLALDYYMAYWDVDNSRNRVYQKIQNILFLQLRYNEALFYAEEAIKNNWVEGYVDKGDLLLQLGQKNNAINSYKLAVENGFENQELIKKIYDLSNSD